MLPKIKKGEEDEKEIKRLFEKNEELMISNGNIGLINKYRDYKKSKGYDGIIV